MFVYCSTSAPFRHWCYLPRVNAVHLAADTEKVIVQFIYLHMLFINWICLVSAAIGTLVFPCSCNFSALDAEFEQFTVSAYEQVFVQFVCLPMLLSNLALTCSTLAAFSALVLSCCLIHFTVLSNSLTSDFERVTVAVYLRMLLANTSLTCLTSAALGALALPLLCIYKTSAADFKQVIFTAWTLNNLNPAAHRALLLPYLLNSKCIGS